MDVISTAAPTSRLTREQIESRVRVCHPIPSLHCIDKSLRSLLSLDQRYTSQISDVIRRDPSLSTRVLQLANSAYLGLSTPVKTVEEAVFYLGIEQVRQLALITPIIEDFQKLAGLSFFSWREFWQHCIGTAILTGEVVGLIGRPNEIDYVAGLVHDVGKIVMAAIFPEQFIDIHQCTREVVQDLRAVETYVLGMDHAELGALFFESHNVPDVFVEAARFHHSPEGAQRHSATVAAVQIANLLIRHSQIGFSGDQQEVTQDECFDASGWRVLFPRPDSAVVSSAHGKLMAKAEHLPAILEGLV